MLNRFIFSIFGFECQNFNFFVKVEKLEYESFSIEHILGTKTYNLNVSRTLFTPKMFTKSVVTTGLSVMATDKSVLRTVFG
jgi:hypothetical protein